jgi:hypothetical protein
VGGEVVQEALDVTMDEADYGYTDWRSLRDCFVRSEGKDREEGSGEDEFRRNHRYQSASQG